MTHRTFINRSGGAKRVRLLRANIKRWKAFAKKYSQECGICYSKMYRQTKKSVCGIHVFHKACLKTWYATRKWCKSCPYCRKTEKNPQRRRPDHRYRRRADVLAARGGPDILSQVYRYLVDDTEERPTRRTQLHYDRLWVQFMANDGATEETAILVDDRPPPVPSPSAIPYLGSRDLVDIDALIEEEFAPPPTPPPLPREDDTDADEEEETPLHAATSITSWLSNINKIKECFSTVHNREYEFAIWDHYAASFGDYRGQPGEHSLYREFVIKTINGTWPCEGFVSKIGEHDPFMTSAEMDEEQLPAEYLAELEQRGEYLGGGDHHEQCCACLERADSTRSYGMPCCDKSVCEKCLDLIAEGSATALKAKKTDFTKLGAVQLVYICPCCGKHPEEPAVLAVTRAAEDVMGHMNVTHYDFRPTSSQSALNTLSYITCAVLNKLDTISDSACVNEVRAWALSGRELLF